jgi:hypothetical protein
MHYETAGRQALHQGNRVDRQNRGRNDLRLDWGRNDLRLEALLSSELFLKAIRCDARPPA